jgi:Flp pilus assembly protein TadD
VIVKSDIASRSLHHSSFLLQFADNGLIPGFAPEHGGLPMRFFIAPLVVLALSAATASAQEIDKDKLRNVLQLPFRLNIFSNIMVPEFRPNAKKEIAKIQKTLDGRASNAESYAKLAELFDNDSNESEGKKARAKAIGLYRERIKAEPQNARLLADFGLVLLADEQDKEAETVLRDAVKLGKEEWKCWQALGMYHFEALFIALQAGKQTDSIAAIQQMQQDGKIQRQDAQRAAASLAEARACFDKAVELAPEKSETRVQRGLFLFKLFEIVPVIKGALGEKVSPVEFTKSFTLAAADFDKAVQLNPDDPLIIANAAITRYFCCLMNSGLGSGGVEEQEAKKGFEEITAHVQRLEKLVPKLESEKAAYALEVLALLGEFSKLGGTDTEEMEARLRQAVKLDPTRESAWRMLILLQLSKKKLDEGLRLSEQQVTANPTAGSYIILAVCRSHNEQWGLAEIALREACKLDARDLYCKLGLAVALLKRPADPKVKVEVAQLLALPVGKDIADLDPNMKRQYMIVMAVNEALYGDAALARKTLTGLSDRHRTDWYLQKLIEALRGNDG